jgi:hypothetical protein
VREVRTKMVTRALALAAALWGSIFAPRFASAQAPRLRGVVYDSISGTHLAGATVALMASGAAGAGRRFGARTDSTGRFEIEGIPAGRYLVSFYHEALDSIGLVADEVVEIEAEITRVALATPSPETLLNTVCPSRVAGDSTGLLLGHVRSTDGEAPIVGAMVDVEWTETTITGSSVASAQRRARVETRDAGAFVLCSAPHGFALLTRASHGADTSGFAAVEVPSRGVRHVTLLVGGAARATEGSWRGTAALSGEVRDEKDRPVANAQVSVWGTGRTARSNDRGAFLLDSLPGGTQTVAVRAIGYAAQEKTVHLTPVRATTVRFVFAERAVTLSRVTVRGEILYSRGMAQFERNRARAIGGHFLLPRDIERRGRSTSLGSLLQGIAGVEVIRRREGTAILMRGAGTYLRQGMGYCSPTLYIDGRRTMLSPSDAESFYVADDLAAIEVYARPMERPMEYQDFNKCGAIGLWTRPPQQKIRPER